jgi:uncharacterized protein with HEPN domain
MIEAAEAAIGFLAGRARSDLDDDRMLFLATASRLSASTRENSPDIPWGDIIGMRNRLTHVYFDVNSDIVWQSTTEELPELLSKLRALLGEP